jgi:Ca-activated chloride channel homolog
MQTQFQIDKIALIIALSFLFLGYFFYRRKESETPPSLNFSSVKIFLKSTPQGRVNWVWLPKMLYLLAFISLLIALIDPHFESMQHRDPQNERSKGYGFYLVVDQSGSMLQESSVGSESKINLLKRVSKKFIQDRPNDLIGLVSFARTAEVLVPLTLDHKLVLQKVDEVEVVTDPTDDGTAIGYAIYKTAHLISFIKKAIKESSKEDIKGAFIVLLTDGFQDPNPLDNGNRLRTMDLSEAAEYAKREEIHLYVINIDTQILKNQFLPYRRILKQITESTGGRFYTLTEGQDLSEVYADIGQLESPFWHEKNRDLFFTRAFSFYPYFILLGMLFLFSAKALETTWLRRFP